MGDRIHTGWLIAGPIVGMTGAFPIFFGAFTFLDWSWCAVTRWKVPPSIYCGDWYKFGLHLCDTTWYGFGTGVFCAIILLGQRWLHGD